MTLTALDTKIALLVVDLQKGLLNAPFDHPLGDALRRARALVKASRRYKLPVLLVNVAGGASGRTEQPWRIDDALPDGFTDFLPELGQQPNDIIVTK